MNRVSEDVNDALTGHAGGGTVGRTYGAKDMLKKFVLQILNDAVSNLSRIGPPPRVSSKNSKANRIETGERSGRILPQTKLTDGVKRRRRAIDQKRCSLPCAEWRVGGPGYP